MAVFSALKNINNMNSVADAFNAKEITSPTMLEAIRLWYELYYDAGGKSKKDIDPAQRVPYIIVDGLCKSAFGEYEYSTDEEVPGGEAVKAALDSLDKIRAGAFLRASIGGEAFIKPLIKNDGNFMFSVIDRRNIVVLGRDSAGNINDMVNSELNIKGNSITPEYYTLVERRRMDNNGLCTVENKLFKSNDPAVIGSLVALDSVPEYAKLLPEFTFSKPLGNLGLIPMRMPLGNCVDGSPDGVSVYAAAAGAILKLYGHEARMQDEYDLTSPHLVASSDVQRRDSDGSLISIPKYITPLLDENPADVGLTVWNPRPNQVELEARDDQIKRAIENIIGLRRGFLSKSDVQEFTATEIVSTTTKMAHLIKSLQLAWEGAVNECIRTCAVLAAIYGLPGWAVSKLPEIVINWGNGILYDEDKEFQHLNILAAQGILRAEYILGWQFNMPVETEEDLAEIRKKYMPDSTEPGDGSGDKV